MKFASILAVFAVALGAYAQETETKEVPKTLGIETTFMPADCPNKAKTGDAIQVHYTGTLHANGNKFDSSHDRGDPLPLTLGIGQVIPGWDEGLQGMCLGEKRILTIPSKKAYGSRGFGSVIPPHSALVFDVELVGLQPKAGKEGSAHQEL